MSPIFINLKRDQSWSEKYYIDLNKKTRRKKNVYPFQRKGGKKGQIQMSTPKSCVDIKLKYY